MEILIALGILLVCALLLAAVMNAWLAVVYVMEGKALYTIAKRRGFSTPWMAWVPFANAWLLGRVSDQYQQKIYGRVCKRGKLLLALKIAVQAVTTIAGCVAGIAAGIVILSKMESGGGVEEIFSVLFTAVGIGLIPTLVVAIVYDVFACIACYDLYASSKPNSAVLFLVLSIVTPATPFLIYACRNSDEGMPSETQE